MKPESDADRPNPISTTPYEYGNDDEYAAFADARDEEESSSYQNARSRDAARARSPAGASVRDLHEDRVE